MEASAEIIELTVRIVSAYLESTGAQVDGVPGLIRAVYATLLSLTVEGAMAAGEGPAPAVSAKKSVTPDYLICLEDGLRFKSLKRHLWAHYQLTPEDYRAKWGLPADYPMVAPNYARTRSKLAKQMGLGRTRAQRRRRQRAV